MIIANFSLSEKLSTFVSHIQKDLYMSPSSYSSMYHSQILALWHSAIFELNRIVRKSLISKLTYYDPTRNRNSRNLNSWNGALFDRPLSGIFYVRRATRCRPARLLEKIRCNNNIIFLVYFFRILG